MSLRNSNCYYRWILSFLSYFFKRCADNSCISLLISRESDKSCDIFHFSINKTFGAIDRINPYTNFLVRDLNVLKFSISWTIIISKCLIIYIYLPFVINSLFSNNSQLGKKSIQAINDHSLNMVISLLVLEI